MGCVGGVVVGFSTVLTLVVFLANKIGIFTSAGRGVRIRTESTVLVRMDAKGVVCRGGSGRGFTPTSIAGMVAVLLAVRRVSSKGVGFSSGIAMDRGTGGVNKDDVLLSANRMEAMRSLVGKVNVTSNGSTTITVTRCLNNDRDGFISVVGSETGRLKVMGAAFGGYANLPISKRVSATCSVSVVSERLLGRPSVLGCADACVRAVSRKEGAPVRLMGRGGLMEFFRKYSKLGAKFAGRTGCYVSTATIGSNIEMLSIVVNTPACGVEGESTDVLVGCNFSGFRDGGLYRGSSSVGRVPVGGGKSGFVVTGTGRGLIMAYPGNSKSGVRDGVILSRDGAGFGRNRGIKFYRCCLSNRLVKIIRLCSSESVGGKGVVSGVGKVFAGRWGLGWGNGRGFGSLPFCFVVGLWFLVRLRRAGGFVSVPVVGVRGFSNPFSLLLRLVGGGGVDVGSVGVCSVAGRCLSCVGLVGRLSLRIASRFIMVTTALVRVGSGSLLPGLGIRSSRGDRRSLVTRLGSGLVRCGVFGGVSLFLGRGRKRRKRVFAGGPRVVSSADVRFGRGCLTGVSVVGLCSVCGGLVGGFGRGRGLSVVRERIDMSGCGVRSGVRRLGLMVRRGGMVGFSDVDSGYAYGLRVMMAFLTLLRLVGSDFIGMLRCSGLNRVVVRGSQWKMEVSVGRIRFRRISEGGTIVSTVRSLLFTTKRPLSTGSVSGVLCSSLSFVGSILKRVVSECSGATSEKVGLVVLGSVCRLIAGPYGKRCIRGLLGGGIERSLSRTSLRDLTVITCGRPVAQIRVSRVQNIGDRDTLRELVRQKLVRRIKEVSMVKEPVLCKAAGRFLECFTLGSLSSLPSIRLFGRRRKRDWSSFSSLFFFPGSLVVSGAQKVTSAVLSRRFAQSAKVDFVRFPFAAGGTANLAIAPTPRPPPGKWFSFSVFLLFVSTPPITGPGRAFSVNVVSLPSTISVTSPAAMLASVVFLVFSVIIFVEFSVK